MSYDEKLEEIITGWLHGFWADWFAEWLCLIDTLFSIVTFNYICPQLEFRFYQWRKY